MSEFRVSDDLGTRINNQIGIEGRHNQLSAIRFDDEKIVLEGEMADPASFNKYICPFTITITNEPAKGVRAYQQFGECYWYGADGERNPTPEHVPPVIDFSEEGLNTVFAAFAELHDAGWVAEELSAPIYANPEGLEVKMLADALRSEVRNYEVDATCNGKITNIKMGDLTANCTTSLKGLPEAEQKRLVEKALIHTDPDVNVSGLKMLQTVDNPALVTSILGDFVRNIQPGRETIDQLHAIAGTIPYMWKPFQGEFVIKLAQRYNFIAWEALDAFTPDERTSTMINFVDTQVGRDYGRPEWFMMVLGHMTSAERRKVFNDILCCSSDDKRAFIAHCFSMPAFAKDFTQGLSGTSAYMLLRDKNVGVKEATRRALLVSDPENKQGFVTLVRDAGYTLDYITYTDTGALDRHTMTSVITSMVKLDTDERDDNSRPHGCDPGI